MKDILQIILMVDAVILILSVLLQARGVGLSATFGGSGAVFRKKRGAEKVLFVISIIASVIFLLLCLVLPYIDQIISKFQAA